MRIGILTLPLHTNYGGILQAYALQTVLERMGHEVVVFQHTPKKKTPLWKWPLKYAKRIWLKLFVNHHTVIFMEKKQEHESPQIMKHIREFMDNRLHLFPVNRLSDLDGNNYDAIIVGSDQVWRPVYFKRMWQHPMQDAFLKFTKHWNVKRLAYAASFGVDDWKCDVEETDECADLIKMFDAVSVREASGVELCSTQLNVQASHVLDPTMLLNKIDYENLIGKSSRDRHDSQQMLFVYILDDTLEKKGLVCRIARERSLKPSRIREKPQWTSRPIEERTVASVETWLRHFNESQMVVTDSFHACVFSILFHKPFVVVGNKSRGMSRFISLLDMFGLQEHLLLDVSEYDPENSYEIAPEIYEKLDRLRAFSIQFLNSNLKS